MIEAHISRCRGCGTPVGRRDRCFNCGARWPQLNREETRAHNRLCVLIFALLVAIVVTIGRVSLRVSGNPIPESEAARIMMGSETWAPPRPPTSESDVSASIRFAGVTDLHTKEMESLFPVGAKSAPTGSDQV